MTEQEANTTMCPFTFAIGREGEPSPQFPGHVMNSNPTGFQQTCLGSGCMAWRWELSEWGHDLLRDKGLAALREYAQRNRTGELSGYCGRAGEP